MTTALTWTANWSLQKMQTSDTNDSSKNETCNYTADDLSRIASVSCGSSVWAQNLSYGASYAASGMTAGCEFGACGPGEEFMRRPGPWHTDATPAERLNYIAWAVHLSNMSGVSDDISNCIITENEDPNLDPEAHNPSGGGFGAKGFMQI